MQGHSVLIDTYCSFDTVVLNSVAKISLNVIICLQIEKLLEPFAKRTIHSMIISTVVNVINKPGIDEDRIALPFNPKFQTV